MKLVEVEMTLETTIKVVVIAEAAVPHVAEAAEAVAAAVAAEMEAADQAEAAVDHLSVFRRAFLLASSHSG